MINKENIESILDVLTKYKKCQDTSIDDCWKVRQDCDDCPYHVTGDVLTETIDQVLAILAEEKTNEINISNQLDLALEIYKVSNDIYEDYRDIEYYRGALNRKQDITTTVSFLTSCRTTTFYPEDLQALIDSKQARLDRNFKYLKSIMESYEGEKK